jgi:hypothetical protein
LAEINIEIPTQNKKPKYKNLNISGWSSGTFISSIKKFIGYLAFA